MQALFRLFQAGVSLAFAAALFVGSWFAYTTYWQMHRKDVELAARARQIERLNSDLEAKQREIQRLDLAMRLLKIDHRVAVIDVLDQGPSDKQDGRNWTKLRFVEVDDRDQPLGQAREFTVDGDIVYVDALVVKFADEYVEQGDPLRATSICLFRRVYGEYQEPSQGYLLDAAGSRPSVYDRGDPLSDFERELWSEFWEYANDPEKRAQAGVRAAHGEAPFQKLLKGRRYRLELRASGGLSFVPDGNRPVDRN